MKRPDKKLAGQIRAAKRLISEFESGDGRHSSNRELRGQPIQDNRRPMTAEEAFRVAKSAREDVALQMRDFAVEIRSTNVRP